MRILFLALGLTFLTQTLAKQQFYKWTDANGAVHYSEKKPLNQKTNTINVSTTVPKLPIKNEETKRITEKPVLSNGQKLAEINKQKQQAKKKAQYNFKKCKKAQGNLAKFKQAAPFRRQDPKTGEYVYLEDHQRAELLKKYKQIIRKTCK